MNPPIVTRIPAPPMDQFNYALRELGEQTMHFVIAFDGCIDDERLNHAVAATLVMVPVLGFRFVEADAPYWERITPLGVQDLVCVHPSENGEQDFQKVLTLPLDPKTSPPLHLDILRSARSDTLCISVHHAAMDAHGLIVYAQLLAACYRDPDSWRGKYLTTGPDRSLAKLLSQFSEHEHAPVAKPPEPLHPEWAFPAPVGNVEQRAFAIRTLSPDRLPVIKDSSHKLGATVNDVLIAAFFSALCDYIHPEPDHTVPILVSIDLRRYLNGKDPELSQGKTFPDRTTPAVPLDTIVNMSVAFNVMMPTGTCTFDDRIRQAVAAMQVHKANNPGLDSAIDIESFGYANFAGIRERVRMMKESAEGSGVETPFLGNIGVIPESSTAFSPSLPVTNAFITGIVINPPGLALGVTTFRNSLTFSIGYGSTAMPQEMMEGFMDRLIGYLPVA